MKRFLALLFLFVPAVAQAKLGYQATVGLESRHYFLERGDFPTNDVVGLRGDLKVEYDEGTFFRFNLHPIFFVDFLDSDLLRYWPLETYVEFYWPQDRIRLGMSPHLWGTGNFFNPTRVLHRRDLEFNFFQPPEMGELSAEYRHAFGDNGFLKDSAIEIIAQPLFQEAPLPELDSRFDLRGRAGAVPYSLTDFQDRPDFAASLGFAASFETSVGASDWQWLYYHGPERLPGYQLWLDTTGALRLLPFYYVTDVVGLNVEAQIKGFRPHLEAALKLTSANDPRPHDVPYENGNALPGSYFQYVPGLDYGFDPPFGGHMTFSLEYMGDSDRAKNLQTFRPFDNDLFFGVYYDFGNRLQSSVQAGLVKDLSNDELALRVEGSTKIYRDLKWNLGAMIVRRGDNPNTPISFFENNSYAYTSLSYTWGKAP